MTHALALDQNIKGEQRTQQDLLTEHSYVLAVVLIKLKRLFYKDYINYILQSQTSAV